MYLGMYDMNTQSVVFNCSAGYCTWSHVGTLAICNSCVDQKAELQLSHLFWDDPEAGDAGLESRCPSPDDTQFLTDFSRVAIGNHDLWTDTMLQSNVKLWPRQYDPDDPFPEWSAFSIPRAYTIGPSGELARVRHLRFAGSRGEELSGLLRDSTDSTIQVTPWTPGRRMADYHECTLSYCVQVHNESLFRSGRLTDPSSNTRTLHFLDSYLRTDASGNEVLPGAVDAQALTETNLTEAFYERTLGLYWIHDYTTRGFLDQINSTFNISFGATSAKDNRGIVMYGNGPEAFPRLMDRVAASLTTALRTGPAMVAHQGAAFSDETFVHVTWPWIVLPTILVLCAAAFLILCVVFSREEGGRVWKSSALALLFLGLRGSEKEDLRCVSVFEMEKKAKAMNARLEQDDDGNVWLMKQ